MKNTNIMATTSKKNKEKKEEFKIVRYSDRPKRKISSAERKKAIEEISASAKQAMGKKARERWAKWLNE